MSIPEMSYLICLLIFEILLVMEDTAQISSASQTSVAPPVEQPVAPSSYSKKNWKKWILIYLIIGAILYAGVYYFVLSKQSNNPYSTTNYRTPTAAPTQTKNLNPNTGNFYNDVKVRLQEEFK